MSKGLDTKEILLEKAKQEFLEKDFEAASMRSICKSAGVTTGAAYFFFKDKNDIFEHIVKPVADGLIYHIKRIEEDSHQTRNNESISLEQAIMENTSKMKQAIDYMYLYKDEFKLLLLKSQGSSMENFCEDLVKLYESLNQDMVSGENEANNIYFDYYSLHMFIHLEIAAILELIKHDLPYEQAIKQAETIAIFFYGGWNAIKGFKKNN